jgi:hypothetical protein
LTTHTGEIKTLRKQRRGKCDIECSPCQTDLTVILNTRQNWIVWQSDRPK